MARSGPLFRIARRSFVRDPWRALLIVVLIGLPVLGITTAALLLETAFPTPTERATRAMGRADLLVRLMGPYQQELRASLPAGSIIEPMWDEGETVVVDGVRRSVAVRDVAADGLASGMVTLLAGALPRGDHEAAITMALAHESGVELGGHLDLAQTPGLVVTGIVEDPRALGRLLVIRPGDLATGADLVPDFLVGLPSGADPAAVRDTLDAAVDRAHGGADGPPMFDATTRGDAGQASTMFIAFIVLLGSLALVEAALVAAAAFAVGIRRRQRDLGLLGAAGATPRQLGGAVLAEGLLAGIIAVIAGIGLGLLLAWLISLRLDDLVGQRTGSLELDPVVLLVAGLVGIVAAVVAAAVPAWGAARLPTLVALSGRRPPSTPARRLLGLGIALVGVAGACALAVPALARSPEGVAVSLLVLVIGAVAGVLGFGACSPWLLERLEGPARRLPLAPRVAVRDTARARTRNGPIVTAVLASVAATIALAAVMASQQARSAEWFRPQVPTDSLMIRGVRPEVTGAQVAAAMGAVGAGPDREAAGPDGAWTYEVVLPLLHPDPAGEMVDVGLSIRVGDEGLLRAYHGDAALDAFRAGTTVVLEAPGQVYPWQVTGSTGRLVRTDVDQATGDATKHDLGAVPVVRIPARGDPDVPTQAIMPTSTADALGLDIDTSPTQFLVRLDHVVTAADVARAGLLATAVDPEAYVTSPLPPPDPLMGFRMLVLGAALLAALTVTAIAVALGESEARADQRTLLALGAPRGLRRRITASRGVVIALLAGLLAVPAGLLPAWGVLTPLDMPLVVPVPEVVGALVLLPLGALIGGLLLGRSLPEWSARRDGVA